MNCQKILTADKSRFSGHFVQFCPVAMSPGIITFLRFQWTLWTNWTFILLGVEKKYFNLYIELKFCPICPVCPIRVNKSSCTKDWTVVDKFSRFCPFCPVLSNNLSTYVCIFMKIYENRDFLQKRAKKNSQKILTIYLFVNVVFTSSITPYSSHVILYSRTYLVPLSSIVMNSFLYSYSYLCSFKNSSGSLSPILAF